jgi:hypothetical protein
MKVKYKFVIGETVEITVAANSGEVMVQLNRDVFNLILIFD